ncbi:MAG: metalloregulator ArsR/SmtB family transcription factor [Candidatus Jordarchaeales archaeon]|nr:winged helix-turn-helix transcriptional regulator [Candidatus Jordarchaeia archaeon]
MEKEELLMKKNVELLKALADETRLRILKLVEEGEKCQCEIIPFIGKSQSTISQHLQTLVSSGILEYRREGQRSFYKLKDDRIKKILELTSRISRDMLLEISKLAKTIES